MEKAYAMPELVAKVKGRGLDLAEESVKLVCEEFFAWLSESAELSATPYDNVLLAVYPSLKQYALGMADKIDGQVG